MWRGWLLHGLQSVQLGERARLSMFGFLVLVIRPMGWCMQRLKRLLVCVRIVILHPSNGASSSRGASQSRVSMACKRSMDWNRQEETFIFHRWRDSGQLGKVEEVHVCWGRWWAGYQSWVPRCTGNHWDSWLRCWQNMCDAAHSPHTCNWIIDVLWNTKSHTGHSWKIIGPPCPHSTRHETQSKPSNGKLMITPCRQQIIESSCPTKFVMYISFSLGFLLGACGLHV